MLKKEREAELVKLQKMQISDLPDPLATADAAIPHPEERPVVGPRHQPQYVSNLDAAYYEDANASVAAKVKGRKLGPSTQTQPSLFNGAANSESDRAFQGKHRFRLLKKMSKSSRPF